MDHFSANLLKCFMTGDHKVALYFLWPCQRKAASSEYPGMVEERSFFSFMQKVEATGVSTR